MGHWDWKTGIYITLK